MSKGLIGYRVLIDGHEAHEENPARPDGNPTHSTNVRAPYHAPYTLADHGEDFEQLANEFAAKRREEGHEVELVPIEAEVREPRGSAPTPRTAAAIAQKNAKTDPKAPTPPTDDSDEDADKDVDEDEDEDEDGE